jgi:Protein of unknown function (DUF4231)
MPDLPVPSPVVGPGPHPGPGPQPGPQARPRRPASSRWSIVNRRQRRFKETLWWVQLDNLDGLAVPVSVVERGAYYASIADLYRRSHRVLEVAVLSFAAAVPVAVAAGASGGVTAALGALAAVCTGVRQTFRPQQNWLDYRRARMRVEAEVVQFLYGVPPYQDPDAATSILVVRIEDIVASQNAEWADRQHALAITGRRAP